MPLVAARPIAEYPWYAACRKQRRTSGRVLDPGFLWGRSPKVFAAVAMLYGALDRRSSPLSPALRSLVTVRVSQLNHCASASTSTRRRWPNAEFRWKSRRPRHVARKSAVQPRRTPGFGVCRSNDGDSSGRRRRSPTEAKKAMEHDTIVELTGSLLFRTCRPNSMRHLMCRRTGFAFCRRAPQSGV